ncbi:MAG: hypothetical protein SNJ54_17465 [Anaerolineae bacterium]
MPVPLSRQQIIPYLQRFLTHNKARGMVAELALTSELGLDQHRQKLLAGGWLLAPKMDGFQRYRYLVSVLPHLYRDGDELRAAVARLEQDRGWQGLATFLSQSGIGIIASGAWSAAPNGLDELRWDSFVYQNERLVPADGDQPFISWPGARGRASAGSPWQTDVLERFAAASDAALTELVLRQAFFYGYLKEQLHKPVDDPYDVDGFIVAYAGTVIPIEIKEKSLTREGDFGIDAGRILMLLRLCLATDSNALYLIRQVDESAARALVSWRYITLADMIMGCRWNLQAGGRGMTGGATQTVMISGDLFQDFGPDNFSEDWLARNSSLQNAIRAAAQELASDLGRYL